MAVLQTTVGPLVGILGVAPDGVLIMVVAWALVRGSEEGMVWGLLGGVCIGLLSGAPMGVHAMILTVIGFVAGLGRGSPFSSRFLIPLLAIAGATVAYDVASAVLLRATGWPLALSPTLARIMVPSLLTNAVLMPLVYGLVLHLFEWRGGLQPEF